MTKTNDYEHVFVHFKKVDPIIYEVLLKVDLGKWFERVESRTTGTDYFVALCRAIVGQQLSGKAASAIYKKFEQFFGGEYTPKQILLAADHSVRNIGLSWAKVKYVKDLAQKFQDNEVDFNSLDSLSEDEVIVELTKVKGVGSWTAEMFLMFTLLRQDIFSFGDLGLRKGIIKLYKIEKPSKEQIQKIIAPWSPYKTFGSVALWQCLEQ
ncbi:MAG: DNA-3-methyladenine glycosylase 2 family protein [Candidatus Pacebacteria bacterium]|nr:DNA-3-methyladenine glycosylase 2 family protein [Candidatus Paceibacterota bacterium]PIR60475.1 MAG: DNA-3-methyladenine glycosylase 2 family protein [Candidatus Pacebacteria bacterium CG10_big_fil_rev_8_21_14_0_10_44_54]